MKGIKGKFLKKLKSIKPLGAIKQGRVLIVKAADGLLDYSSPPPPPAKNSNGVLQSSLKCRKQEQSEQSLPMEAEVIEVSELMRDLEDQEMGFEDNVEEDKENIGPIERKPKDPFEDMENSSLSESGSYSFRSSPLAELDVSSFKQSDSTSFTDNSENGELEKSNLGSTQRLEVDELGFRRPKLNSSTLFDPNLLEAFQKVAAEHMKAQEQIRRARIDEKGVEKDEEVEPPAKTRRVEQNPLSAFEEKCPPGGSESVILYTTTLRGIRKTFEDCNSIMFLLGSFRIQFMERDVSMHLEFREEMWRVLGRRVVPPRLFIKGRYIGGADEVVGLHERGQLLELFEGMPRNRTTSLCDACGGMRFVMCSNCNGSRKILSNEGEDVEDLFVQCPQCNENGLIVCPICC